MWLDSMESDFDLSQSKLKYLGGDLSSLHILDQQTPQGDRGEIDGICSYRFRYEKQI